MGMQPLGFLFDAIPIVEPIDLDNSQSGDQWSMRDCDGVAIMFITGVGAAGRDLTFTLKKHTSMSDVTGTTIDMSALRHPYYYYKQGAAATCVGVGTWARGNLSDTDGASVVLDAAEGETSTLIFFYVDAADLGDGYTSLSLSAIVAGGSGAKLGSCVVFPVGLNVQRVPTNLRTALA